MVKGIEGRSPFIKGEITKIAACVHPDWEEGYMRVVVRYEPTDEFPYGEAQMLLPAGSCAQKTFTYIFREQFAPLDGCEVVLRNGEVFPLEFPIPVWVRLRKEARPADDGTMRVCVVVDTMLPREKDDKEASADA